MKDEAEFRDNQKKSRSGCLVIAFVMLPILYALNPPFAVIIYRNSPAPFNE